jgi:DNA-binding response OmpR family regulator
VRIVVIDDDVVLLGMLEQMLVHAGHTVAAFSHAADAMAEIARAMPDVLITDVLMPDIDGIELIKNVRRTNADLWIVAMSGGGHYVPTSISLKMAKASGADRTLQKPFRRADLLRVIVPE